MNMETAIADVWVYLCEAGHLHVAARAAGGSVSDAVVDDPRVMTLVKEICRDERGRFASCPGASGGAAAKPPDAPAPPAPAVRPGKTQARKVAERQEAADRAHALVSEIKASGKADPDKIKELAGHLGKLTVQQLHALKGQHGLKASAATKAALTAKLLNQFTALAHADRPSDSTHPSEPADPWKGRPEPFASSGSIDRWGEKNYGPTARSMSRDEQKAVDDYKSIAYEGLNKHLRDGGDPNSSKLTSTAWAKGQPIDFMTSHLDAVLGKTPTDRDLIVFRGANSHKLVDQVKDNVGGTFTDKAYLSTSPSKDVAKQFMAQVSSSRQPKLMWEIHVPKGSRGAYVSTNDKGSDENEQEFLLPRDSKFRILEVNHDASANRYHVKARLEQ
jgi:hypothetical protein